MLLHAYIPVDILTSTILPIPKDRKKYLHDSSNYRGIALNSPLGKILDHILLTNYKNIFQTSDRQFGFKAKHSTVQCTFVDKEILQYYITRGSSLCYYYLTRVKPLTWSIILNYLICSLRKEYVHSWLDYQQLCMIDNRHVLSGVNPPARLSE